MRVNAKKELSELFDNLADEFIEKEILPVLQRYGWCIYWANGAVGVVNKKDEDLSECKTVLLLEKKAKQVFGRYINKAYHPLWDILTSYSGKNINTGLMACHPSITLNKEGDVVEWLEENLPEYPRYVD